MVYLEMRSAIILVVTYILAHSKFDGSVAYSIKNSSYLNGNLTDHANVTEYQISTGNDVAPEDIVVETQAIHGIIHLLHKETHRKKVLIGGYLIVATVIIGLTWMLTTYFHGKNAMKKNPWKYQNSIPHELLTRKKFSQSKEEDEDDMRKTLYKNMKT